MLQAKAAAAKETVTVKPVVEKPEKPAEQKPPAILAKGIVPQQFTKMMTEKGISGLKYKKAGNQIAIKCRTTAQHKVVMEQLQTKYDGGHSYTPKSLKKTIMLMKDVHESVPIEDVIAAIKEQTGLVVEAKRMVTPRSKNKGYVLDIVMVTTEEENVKCLVKTRHVHNIIIKWQRMVKKGITQCHRCQQFGHISLNCLNKFRCVKCSLDHGPGECKRNTDDDPAGAYCANCKKKGHPASFRGCPKALALLQKVDTRKTAKIAVQEQKAHIEAALNNYVGEETYAQVTGRQPAQQHRQQQQQTPPRPGMPAGFLGEECSKHFGMDLPTLMEKAKTFKPHYRQLKTAQEQQLALLGFIFQLC